MYRKMGPEELEKIIEIGLKKKDLKEAEKREKLKEREIVSKIIDDPILECL